MDLFDILIWSLVANTLAQAIRSILRKRSVKLPPVPIPFPIIGNILELDDKPHKSLAKLARTYGPIMSLKLGQLTTIVISSSTMAREVLQKHDLHLSSRTIPDSMRAHNHDQLGIVWLPVAAAWRNVRKMCNSNIFTSQKLDANQYLRSKKLQELVEHVQESSRLGAVVEIGQVAFKTSLNLLSNTVFSVDLADQNSDTAREFKKEVEHIMEVGGKPNLANYFPLLRMIDPQGLRRRMNGHFGKILGIIGNMIDQRLHSKKSQQKSNDVLDALLDSNNNKEDEELHKTFMEHLLLDLFGAGTDTTSNTVEWTMAELLHNPDKLRKAQEELEQRIGRGNTVKETDISGLPYLQAVVKEAMRMHPAVPLLLPRKADQDVEICGVTIPKGAQVLVNAWAIGRDPNIWDSPDSFLPERFVGSKIDVRGRDFELIPFGSGRRICPGLPLAHRMVHVMVASLIHGFDWKLEDGMSAEEMNLDDKFGLTIGLVHPIRAVPISKTQPF